MTYKQPSHGAALESSSLPPALPETVSKRVGEFAAATLGRAALLRQRGGEQGDLLADLENDGLPTSSHTPDTSPQTQAETPSPREQSTQPTRENLYALQRIINSYDHQVAQHPRSKTLKKKRAAAWYNLDIAIAESLGMTPKQYAEARTNRDAQFDKIVLKRMRIRREVKEAAQATHPSQTAAQRRNRPQQEEPEGIDRRSAAAGEGVRSLSKLDY